jgi:hypothetical protein
MKEALLTLFEQMGVIEPPRLAVASTADLRAHAFSRCGPDGLWEVSVEVAPNTRRSQEEGLDGRSLKLQSTAAYDGVREGAGRFVFRGLPAGKYRVIVEATVREKLAAVVNGLTQSFAQAKALLADPFEDEASSRAQVGLVPVMRGTPKGQTADGTVRWELASDGGKLEMRFWCSDRALLNQDFAFRVGDLQRTVTFVDVGSAELRGWAQQLPKGAFPEVDVLQEEQDE